MSADIHAAEKQLIPLGRTTGIKMFSGGAMVIGFASEKMLGCISPAEQNGLQIGDVITAVNGTAIECNEQLSDLLSALPQPRAELTIRRNGEEMVVNIEGLAKTTNGYKLGAWVRDSMAGIGTITYVDPETGDFGALGHGICDVDTGGLMPFDNGSIMGSEVIAVTKGRSGAPGQLSGTFDLRQDNGVLFKNTMQGVFGRITDPAVYAGKKAYAVADTDEIRCGKIEIISNVDGAKVERYAGRITKILEDDGSSKNFMIEITDKDLIEQTGGIVQGMSGSPIIQDGKLVGAVTHVLVNDPTRGYGIFIENMLEAAK
ncbi:MAG: SpoIVB peptidase [Clostridia bacterium]|nr:SpoIVB peptidase [Clostridia bacterium]